MKYQNITLNFKPTIKWGELEGRQYMVVPMVILNVGVHKGSQGPLYYPKEELEKTPAAWNHKPIIVYHPLKSGAETACEPEVLNSQKIGIIMNTRFENNSLKAEAWLDESRVKLVDPRILDAIKGNVVMELSTGLFTDNEIQDGVWNEVEEYVAVARNHRPDHVAILPDQVGACSVADGAGLLRNEKSMNNIRELLSLKLSETVKNAWVEDVYQNFFIYEQAGKLYKMGYKIENETVSLEGSEPQEVVKVIEYRDKQGSFIGNERKEKMKDKKKMLVDQLVENGSFSESDRNLLMGFPEERLEKLNKVLNEAETPAESTKEDVPAETPAGTSEGVVTTETPAEPTKKVTAKEYIENAPPEIREMLETGLKTHYHEKAKLVGVILNHKKNTFTKEQLSVMNMESLKAIATLAVEPEQEKSDDVFAAFGASLTENASDEESLSMPSILLMNEETK